MALRKPCAHGPEYDRAFGRLILLVGPGSWGHQANRGYLLVADDRHDVSSLVSSRLKDLAFAWQVISGVWGRARSGRLPLSRNTKR